MDSSQYNLNILSELGFTPRFNRTKNNSDLDIYELDGLNEANTPFSPIDRFNIKLSAIKNFQDLLTVIRDYEYEIGYKKCVQEINSKCSNYN